MKRSIRNAPNIPDHEVLRKIGGGSYGEVWLARAVTGVLRAIKVIWRDDFDNDKDFERELEGIHHYEPLSRNHPGLIPILHVGRTKGEAEFYYYVMELGDDIQLGQEFHPVEYIPRTLRSDLKKADGEAIDIDQCLQLGVEMSEALEYLHEKGLAHRDVKPANIVFYEGRPKLADIGLVAMPGQRTFVGTEGFVPPEGPGTRKADVYSIGKVLYEMATGQDRLDFPNLPDYHAPPEKARQWHLLNSVICDVCDPRLSHRGITTAAELSSALKRIQGGKKPKKKIPRKLQAVLMILPLPLLLLVGWLASNPEKPTDTEKPQKEYALVKILSDPSGAEVRDMNGKVLGTTPLAGREVEVGVFHQYEFTLEGYATTIEGKVAQPEGMIIQAELPIYAPPVNGEKWVDVLGFPYKPLTEGHESLHYVSPGVARRFFKSPQGKNLLSYDVKYQQEKVRRSAILTEKSSAEMYCNWLTQKCIDAGYLTEDFVITPVMEKQLRIIGRPPQVQGKAVFPFKCRVLKIPFGSIKVEANVSDGVSYFIDGGEVLPDFINNSVYLPKIKPGERQLSLEAEGYREKSIKVNIPPYEEKAVTITLKPDRSVVFGQAWKNSLEIPLVPIKESLMASAYEITIDWYKAYLKAENKPTPPQPSFPQAGDHPVVNITKAEAEEFCAWLTRIEQKKELIGEGYQYRLPTDQEWSYFCGLAEESGETPFERDVSSDGEYIWGEEWPPAETVGNFADDALVYSSELSTQRSIIGFHDGTPYTAPVGEYTQNELELYDLAGNVYEWVANPFGVDDYIVSRGGSWKTYQKENLYRTFRNALKPDERNSETGFRIVLIKE